MSSGGSANNLCAMESSEAQAMQERGEGGRFNALYDRFEIIDKIVEQLREGEPLAAICRQPGMPSPDAVARWCEADEGAARAIARARELGEDAIALDILRISDGLSPVPGVPQESQRDKLRVDTRLKLLAKFNPKRWGDSTQIKHADADGNKLDTAPLVNELLSAMGGASNAPLTLINVTPNQDSAPASGYKPPEERIKLRRAPVVRASASDVDDLV